MRKRLVALAVLTLAPVANGVAQGTAVYQEMHWRQIGPTRAGRARALAGVPSRSNVFYIGFDNGGVWRSTDFGSTWTPIFDQAGTGSVGAIAVSPSDPNVIYVGTGAGIIRPDLAYGEGIYKSIDGGKTWTHLASLRDTKMIAMIDVDPKNPDRIFVAALGHPYGPNTERGIFRSTDGGRSFQKVLYKDEYTSGNDVRIDPSDPNTVYATLWQQQQSFIEGQGFGGSGNGIFKSTDGGTTWKQLTDGLPSVIQANLAIAASNSKVLYATVAGDPPNATRPSATGVVGFYKSVDAGEHWQKVGTDPRPLARIGGGDLPTVAVDTKNPDVVYTASTVMWRTEDAGATWTAVRGAPGGDDYQKIWINPTNPDVILVVADQGGVVSANRGQSWSNWYTQPTAAMYHVSVDDDFPYRVCGGQQDSGSACVASRSMDGEITFHDWHPVNIQEYGIAASDPKDPDIVFGSQRTGVSRYDRRTGQTAQVGPDRAAANAQGFGRNVRTMPIAWSPVDHNTLFYTSNVVWKSTDRAKSWTRISPDLARQTWAVPANAGKYAADVKPAPLGAITALSPSPKDIAVLWAGTDDGNVQVTMNGGTTWTNVTPPSVKPWARVFNLDAGHFDTKTAYAAVNTMRLDEYAPHFYKTHDGGKTWTEISSMGGEGVANSIREDPRTPGLLYAGTDTQVWVSFDDGEHWRSLKLDMPAISVRDLLVKDDSICKCSDLVAATHGRGFWILDDVTPLRQAAKAEASSAPYLFAPAPALRVRYATNDPTPWPPELPAGENPPPGGILDYYLPNDASGPVSVEILDAAGKVVRHYTSTDPKLDPDPALDMAGYDKVCQRNPQATHCEVPLYWPAPQMRVSTAKGMHRIAWDLHYDPIANASAPEPGGDDDATGVVPRHSYPDVRAPWAPPGRYTVRLTADGKTSTQPLVLYLDPRVKTPASGLAALNQATRDAWAGAHTADSLYTAARALAASASDAMKARIDSIAPPATRGGGRRGFGGFGPAPNAAPTLSSVRDALVNAAMAMQNADVAPTATQMAALQKGLADLAAVRKRWAAVSASR